MCMYVCMHKCVYVLATAHMHTAVCIWNLEDQLRCQYVPSTLF